MIDKKVYSVTALTSIRECVRIIRFARLLKQSTFHSLEKKIKDKYVSKGHVGLDPEVILKLIFLLFWDDVKSERELMKVLADRLDYLWFVSGESAVEAKSIREICDWLCTCEIRSR